VFNVIEDVGLGVVPFGTLRAVRSVFNEEKKLCFKKAAVNSSRGGCISRKAPIGAVKL
jgi:hypothetical protein